MAGTAPGTPGTPSVLRAMNDRAALDLLVAHGPLTRTRIGELTGLSKPTTSQLLSRLEAVGLVRTTGSQTGRPGPAAVLYEIHPGAAHIVAVSADPTGITAVVADIAGAERGRCRIEAVAVADDVRNRTAQLVAEAFDGALRRAGLGHDDITATVIGTPGAIDPHTGQLRYAPHLPGWHSRTLLAELAEVLGTPVSIENDVNLAAIAEQYEGAAQDHDDFVLAYVDEGVGAAIVLGGVLLRGATGGAGEIGYMPLPGAPLARGGEEEIAGEDAGAASRVWSPRPPCDCSPGAPRTWARLSPTPPCSTRWPAAWPPGSPPSSPSSTPSSSSCRDRWPRPAARRCASASRTNSPGSPCRGPNCVSAISTTTRSSPAPCARR